VLTVSPALMSGYLRAASQISRQAVGDPQPPGNAAYNIPRVLNQMKHVEGTPMGTRGGISVVHNLPADGDYIFKLSFYYTPTGSRYGAIMGKGQQIEVSVNGERAALVDIDPASKQATENIKTPPMRIQAGPQRVSATFIENAEGPVEDSFRPIEQSLVDVSIGYVPGITAPFICIPSPSAGRSARRGFRYAQPPPDLQLPSGERKRGVALRQETFVFFAAAGLATAGHRWRFGSLAELLLDGAQSGRLRIWHPDRNSGDDRRPELCFSLRTHAGQHRGRSDFSHWRSRSCLAAVLFLVEQRAGRCWPILNLTHSRPTSLASRCICKT